MCRSFTGYCFVVLTIILVSCKKKNSGSGMTVSIVNETIILNPTGYSPLAAVINIETSDPIKISIRIAGKHGAASDVIKDFVALSAVHSLPVLGLYPDFENIVELIFFGASGNEVGRKSYSVKTAPLPENTFPQIVIDKNSEQATKGMTLVNYFGFNVNRFPQNPFIFDAFGDIRWYFDFRNHPLLKDLFYDDGPERLQNGNLYFGDGGTDKIYETDLLGTIINTWDLPGFKFHHNVQEKPNGNFLVTVSKNGASTIEDFIIEIDRNSKQIINTWDLNQSLQYDRRTLLNEPVDWIHVNAVVYDQADNTIIISGRTQGVVKLNQANKVVWILGCHLGWNTAGNGENLRNYLLQPFDKNDNPIQDPDILDGISNHPDFEWNWYQHAPLVKENGNIMLFDNGGNNRNFSGAGQYSRAVEYSIDKVNSKVKQVWSFGKEIGAPFFSQIVSDVDFISTTNHVIISSGAVNFNVKYGKIIEVDYQTKTIVFEATLTPTNQSTGITFHRTERLSLYP